jgi:hypothetical protein
LGALVGWLLRKTGLDPAIAAEAVAMARAAVLRVEETVKLQAVKIPGPEKLKAALALIDEMSKRKPEVATYLRTAATGLVEGVLQSDLTPAEMTPK